MIDVETYAAAKAYTDAHGGEGGTSNYNALENKPQINAVELSGNKTAEDLGLVAAVAGKGLSTNDYDNTEKGKVADNTAAIGAMVNENGCCNVMPSTDYNNTENYGIYYTTNADKSITAQGATGSDPSSVPIIGGYISNKYVGYKLSGCVGGSNETYFINVSYSNDGSTWATDNYQYDEPITIANYPYIKIWIAVRAGVTINTVFYPMLHDARLKPTGYVSPAMTNRELTESVIDLKNNTPRIVSGTIVVNLPQASAYGFYYFFFPSGAFAVGKTITIVGANFVGSSTELKSYISAEAYAPTDAGRIYKIEANETVASLKNSPLLISYSVG